jgi:acyl dehydratase
MALTALGATPLSEQLKLSMIALVEQQAIFQKPLFKYDTVRSEFEIEGIERRPDKEWGTLRIKIRLLNHRDEIVLEGRHVYRIRGKAATASHGGS